MFALAIFAGKLTRQAVGVPKVYSIRCAPAPDGVAVDPCGTVGGVALSPVLVAENPFDGSSGIELFGYGFGLVGGLFIVGFVIGSVLRVIRSA